MAVTRTANIIRMTAAADSFAGRLYTQLIRFIGTGLTAGQTLTLQDINGSLAGEHFTTAAQEDVQLEFGSKTYGLHNGIKISAGPAAGTWEVLIHLL